MITSIELCAGAGGQALGLERARFNHQALVEIEAPFCSTLRHNRPGWNVVEQDLRLFDGRPYRGADLLAGGLPCPPFSKAGKQLGDRDERNLFPAAIRLIEEVRPRALLIENVRGFLDAVFEPYREHLKAVLHKMGYTVDWRLLLASDYGVPQLRPRVAIVAVRKGHSEHFDWPLPSARSPLTVGEALIDLMRAGGWEQADAWCSKADAIAPTVVGGSKKHGGPDLGPTRARQAWATLGVNGKSLADVPPEVGFVGDPRLTVRMVARLQGFPDDWEFVGKKTIAYRQVGNAFPPPVAHALGKSLRRAISHRVTYPVFHLPTPDRHRIKARMSGSNRVTPA